MGAPPHEARPSANSKSIVKSVLARTNIAILALRHRQEHEEQPLMIIAAFTASTRAPIQAARRALLNSFRLPEWDPVPLRLDGHRWRQPVHLTGCNWHVTGKRGFLLALMDSVTEDLAVLRLECLPNQLAQARAPESTRGRTRHVQRKEE